MDTSGQLNAFNKLLDTWGAPEPNIVIISKREFLRKLLLDGFVDMPVRKQIRKIERIPTNWKENGF